MVITANLPTTTSRQDTGLARKATSKDIAATSARTDASPVSSAPLSNPAAPSAPQRIHSRPTEVVAIDTVTLCVAFVNNPAKAEQTYKSKLIRLACTVEDISNDGEKWAAKCNVTNRPGNPNGVVCLFDGAADIADLKPDNSHPILIEGEYLDWHNSGGSDVAGGVCKVYLDKCKLIKEK
jgi:hypothetical protein